MRALLVAYKCSPFRGSEWAVGWGRAIETAKRHSAWVITSELSRPDVERFTAEGGRLTGLTFCFVPPSRIERALALLPSFGGAYNYFAYRAWQRQAFRMAAKLHRELHFDLTHQVNISGFREPGYLWKLDAPFIWGPLGGTQLYPWRFLATAGLRGAIKEAFRNIVTQLQFQYSPAVRRAARKAAVVLVANSQVQQDFLKMYRVPTALLLETGLPALPESGRSYKTPGDAFHILWSGDLQPHKALHLLLHALVEFDPEIPFELRILGRGNSQDKSKKLAHRLGIEAQCSWLGWLPHAEAMRQCEWADVFVFTSLRDTSGNVILEALSHGVPAICLAHQGAGDIVTDSCGIKVPVTNFKAAVAGFRAALLTLARDRDYLAKLSRGARSRALYYLWSRNGDEMARIYDVVVRGAPIPQSALVADENRN